MIEQVIVVGEVSSEGGPLLIGDSASIRSWNGYTGEAGDDYSRACELFDSDPSIEGGTIKLLDDTAVLWEMQGGGIASVGDLGDGELLIVRPWLHEAYTDDTIIMAMVAPPSLEMDLGTLTIASGSIAILWAAESGKGITDEDTNRTGPATGDLSVPGSGLIITTTFSGFCLTHDYVKGTWGQARRCRLVGY